MRVEVLTVGDELLTGEVADTNAAWLGRRITESGLVVGALAAVGDEAAAVTAAARAALSRADALIVTGGLGPTSDDITEDALVPLADSAAGPGAVTRLPNTVGTAAGLRIETGAGVVYAVPGVPAEMTAMVTAAVLPDLIGRAGAARVFVTRTVYVALLPEPSVATALAPVEQALQAAGAPCRVAYLVSPGQVRVRLTAGAGSREAARELVEPWLVQVSDRLGDHVSGVDETLDVTVHRLLAGRGGTVAVAESLTGGLLGAALTAMAGSSTTFRGGVTAYATDLKAGLLGVDPDLLAARGAVDAGVAAGMAAGVRDRLNATYGLATTGVAGPEPQDGKPPGTVHVAVSDHEGTASSSPRLTGDRERIRTLTVVHALDLIRRRMAGLPTRKEGVR